MEDLEGTYSCALMTPAASSSSTDGYQMSALGTAKALRAKLSRMPFDVRKVLNSSLYLPSL